MKNLFSKTPKTTEKRLHELKQQNAKLPALNDADTHFASPKRVQDGHPVYVMVDGGIVSPLNQEPVGRSLGGSLVFEVLQEGKPSGKKVSIPHLFDDYEDTEYLDHLAEAQGSDLLDDDIYTYDPNALKKQEQEAREQFNELPWVDQLSSHFLGLFYSKKGTLTELQMYADDAKTSQQYQVIVGEDDELIESLSYENGEPVLKLTEGGTIHTGKDNLFAVSAAGSPIFKASDGRLYALTTLDRMRKATFKFKVDKDGDVVRADRITNTSQYVHSGGQSSYYNDQYYDQFNFGKQSIGAERDVMGEYKRTGVWTGYSAMKSSNITYAYVLSMANALSGLFNIKVQTGDSWHADLQTQTLTYNPMSLMSGTKSDLLLTLLHEVGRIKHSTHVQIDDVFDMVLSSPKKIIEDARIDEIIKETYPGAEKIFKESIEAPIKALHKHYDNNGDEMRKMWQDIAQSTVEQIDGRIKAAHVTGDNKSVTDIITSAFEGTTPQEIAANRESVLNWANGQLDVKNEVEGRNILHITSSLLGGMYNLPNLVHKIDEPYVEQCMQKMADIVKKTDTNSVYDAVEQELMPILKPYVDNTVLPPALAESLGEELKKGLAEEMQNQLNNGHNWNLSQDIKNTHENSAQQMNANSSEGDVMPQDWMDGDYNGLRLSVLPETKALTRFLRSIQREEQTPKFERNQRRGRIDQKAVHKVVMGHDRVFKKKLPSQDTIRSFAFSLVIDTSGSMNGESIIHTTRAAISMIESLEAVGIPYEVICFDSDASHRKKFSDPLSNKIKEQIGGIIPYVSNYGGGTNMYLGFQKVTLQERSESNKILVMLTDGGVSSPQRYYEEFVQPFAKKHGIRTFTYGLVGNDGWGDPDSQAEGMLNNLQGITQDIGQAAVVKQPVDLIRDFNGLLKNLVRHAKNNGQVKQLNKINLTG